MDSVSEIDGHIWRGQTGRYPCLTNHIKLANVAFGHPILRHRVSPGASTIQPISAPNGS